MCTVYVSCVAVLLRSIASVAFVVAVYDVKFTTKRVYYNIHHHSYVNLPNQFASAADRLRLGQIPSSFANLEFVAKKVVMIRKYINTANTPRFGSHVPQSYHIRRRLIHAHARFQEKLPNQPNQPSVPRRSQTTTATSVIRRPSKSSS